MCSSDLGRAAPRAPGPYVGHTAATASPARVEEGHRVIDWFLGALPQAACLAPRNIVITVDGPRPQLYDAGELAEVQTSYFVQMRNRLISEAKSAGFKVIDMQPRFLTAFAADRQQFEFSIDGHWNAHGHEVTAAAVLEALADWPPLADRTR